MPFRVFRAGNLSRAHERRQMNLLISLLHQEFANRTEDIRLIVDFRIGRQIDSMVFKDGKFIILELKDIGGRITASLVPGGPWRFTENGEETELERSPFSQVGGQRASVMEFFWEGVLDNRKPLNHPAVRTESFRRHFGGWVVTKSGADINFIGRNPLAVQWFAALPIDDVPRSLRYERGEGLLSSEEHFDRFIELIGAEERPWNEWMLGGRLVSTDEDVVPARIAQVDFLFSSSKPEQVRRALQHVYELGLVDYLQNVCIASASPDKSVRRMALEILLAWDPPELGRLLVQFLYDDSPELRNHVLNVMRDRPCPEAIPELADLLKSEDLNEVVSALRALGATEHTEAGQAALEYAKGQSIDEIPDENVPWYTIINALGRLSCREAVPWLLELLTHLEDLVPVGKDNHIDIIREEIVHSLGEIGDSCALEPLLKRLRTYTDEWTIAPIRALARLGDPEAVDYLVPYLDTDEDWMKEEVARALCGIGSDEVYKPLSRFYFRWLEEHGLSAIHHHIEDTLVSIDAERTEELVLDYIQKKELSDDEVGWRMMYILYRVASEACVDTVSPYFKNKTFYLQAAEILWRVESLELEKRVNELLESEDPNERAAAVWYMSRKWGRDLLYELKKFEDDPDRVVRRAVADLYNFMNNITGRTCLLRMVADEDLVVQYTVYSSHIGESIHFLDSSWVFFGDEAHKVRYVLLTEGGILAWLDEKEEYPKDEQETEDRSQKLLFIEAKNIERAVKAELNGGDSGLYVVTGTDPERYEYLIKPEDPFGIVDPDRELSTFLHELMGVSHRDLGPPSLNMEETEAVKRLWSLSKSDTLQVG